MALRELKRFQKLFLYFQIWDYLFMPADRDFGLIRRQRKEKRYCILEDVINLIGQASQNLSKFSVVKVNKVPAMILMAKVYQGIQSCHLLFRCIMNFVSTQECPYEITSGRTISSVVTEIFRLRNTILNLHLPEQNWNDIIMWPVTYQ